MYNNFDFNWIRESVIGGVLKTGVTDILVQKLKSWGKFFREATTTLEHLILQKWQVDIYVDSNLEDVARLDIYAKILSAISPPIQ